MERDRVCGDADYVCANFNSHAHVERDPDIAVNLVNVVDFNSHAHVERDWHATPCTEHDRHFNSHAHVERDPIPFSARRKRP